MYSVCLIFQFFQWADEVQVKSGNVEKKVTLTTKETIRVYFKTKVNFVTTFQVDSSNVFVTSCTNRLYFIFRE